MNAKTLEAVTRHGQHLLAIFPNATERDPVALCKKLRRIETVAHQLAEDCCNHLSMESPEYDKRHNAIIARAAKLLGVDHIPKMEDNGRFHINMDPRGYALKLGLGDSDMYPHAKIHRDWGGYGIIAPDLTEAHNPTRKAR